MTYRRDRNALFAIGQAVRYKPGTGTYGYEDALAISPDGRLAGTVVGHSPSRVRVTLVLERGRTVTRCVAAVSLRVVDHGEVCAPTAQETTR